MTYIQECVTVFYGGIMYTSFESILVIFMQQIYIQLEILIKRLFQITNLENNVHEKIDIYEQECNIIRECVNHHICIFL